MLECRKADSGGYKIIVTGAGSYLIKWAKGSRNIIQTKDTFMHILFHIFSCIATASKKHNNWVIDILFYL